MRTVKFAVSLGCLALPGWQALGAPEGTGRPELNGQAEAFRLQAPLHYALRERNYEDALAAMRLQHDIDEVAEDESGTASQPLCLAARDASADAYDMVRALLLTYGADPNVHDGRGYTPLHHAAANGNLAVAELLLRHGADVDAAIRGSDAPMTPLYLATRFGMNRTAAVLRSYGADALNEDLASQLKVDAAIESARAAAMERAEHQELAFPDAIRIVYRETIQAAAEELEAAGRFREASIWRDFEARSAELVIPNARDANSNPKAWIAVTMQKLLAEIQGSVTAAVASGANP